MSTNQNNPATANRFRALIIVLSLAIPALVSFVIMQPQTGKLGTIDVSVLPKFHAILNSLTAISLVTGWYFIRNKNRSAHRLAMLTAFVLSSIFLVSYVVYHYQAAPTRFGGEGLLKGIYYFILLTHIVLAAAIVPLVLFSVYFGLTNQFTRHRRVARWTFPLWLYVAITGVLVYWMISPYYS